AELERRELVRLGIGVHVVGCIRDALTELEQQHFSAILLDYHLPDGDPWRVVEAAKTKVPAIPVILVTAMGSERIASEALHRGVAEYVKKSDSFWEQLPQTVERVTRLADVEERPRRTDPLFAPI